MRTEGIKSLLMLIALVLAVVVVIPFVGALILLLRTAGLFAIGAGLTVMAVATAVSPTFRHHVMSFGWTATEPDFRHRIGGM